MGCRGTGTKVGISLTRELHNVLAVVGMGILFCIPGPLLGPRMLLPLYGQFCPKATGQVNGLLGFTDSSW
jgi:hypothetical protein